MFLILGSELFLNSFSLHCSQSFSEAGFIKNRNANNILIDEKTHQESKRLLDLTKGERKRRFLIERLGQEPLVVPEEVGRLIESLLTASSSNGKIFYSFMPDELTSVAAAGFLGVSRPTLIKYVRDGLIPAHKVGTHLRVKMSDLVRFRESKLTKQSRAIAAMKELALMVGEAE